MRAPAWAGREWPPGHQGLRTNRGLWGSPGWRAPRLRERTLLLGVSVGTPQPSLPGWASCSPFLPLSFLTSKNGEAKAAPRGMNAEEALRALSAMHTTTV